MIELLLTCSLLGTVHFDLNEITDIHKVSYGNDIVNSSGEERYICVHGNPGTEFELLLTKAVFKLDRNSKSII